MYGTTPWSDLSTFSKHFLKKAMYCILKCFILSNGQFAFTLKEGGPQRWRFVKM